EQDHAHRDHRRGDRRARRRARGVSPRRGRRPALDRLHARRGDLRRAGRRAPAARGARQPARNEHRPHGRRGAPAVALGHDRPQDREVNPRCSASRIATACV
ncbi:MAG: hypothetical protein AVDCRST_MAG67-3138, partial [uncultured Solirubrobacteraceae bacterium]